MRWKAGWRMGTEAKKGGGELKEIESELDLWIKVG